MRNVTAVVLAAGVSRRMGPENKLLLPVEREPMIVRTLRAYLEVCDKVLVVTGYEAQKISHVLRHLKLRIVHNPDYADGQATSVGVGLRAAMGADYVLVGLADQPCLLACHLDELLAAHLRSGGTKITVPHNGMARGNPIVIPGSMIPDMLKDKQNPGCGKFTRARPDVVDFYESSEPAYFRDIDTPHDYATLIQCAPTAECAP